MAPSAKDLLELFKVKQTALLLVTGVCAYLEGAGKPDPATLVLASLSMFLSIAGTTGFNMVLDADIDSAMFRTRNRPLPARRMSAKDAVLASSAALAAGLAAGVAVNPYVFVAGLLGFLIDIAVYTVLLKRKSPWSVVFGGFAGGMPALGGWAAATGGFGYQGVLLMLLVAVWSSLHIWTLSTYYSEDYRRAGVPMLPAVYGERAGVVASLAAAVAVFLVAFLAFRAGLISAVGFAVAAVPLILAVAVLLKGLVSGEYREKAYRAFKLVNIFMGLFFVLLVLT